MLALACVAGTAAAQEATNYPSRPVTMIVSYAPGNITDILARSVADALSRRWQQPVPVENRPGQGGSLGAQAALKAPADGYTLLFSAMAAMAINPHVYTTVGYDPLKDFAPIVSVAVTKGVLVVNGDVPVKTFAELIEYSKANPQALNYASLGNGTAPHLNFEALKAATGLQAQHIPYKASSSATTDLVGGRVHLQQESLGVLLPMIREGKARPLFTSSPQRLVELPDVPTATEVAPGYTAVAPWLGILVRADVPMDIQQKLERDILEVLADPAMDEKLDNAGLTKLAHDHERFRQELEADHERLGKLVRELKVGVD